MGFMKEYRLDVHLVLVTPEVLYQPAYQVQFD